MRFFVALIVALWAFAFFSRECNLVVVTICMVLCCIFSLIPTLVIDFFKHDRNEAIKYVVICIAVFNCMILSSVFSHMALVVWIFPILLTSLYYNKTLVVFTALMSTVGVILADFINGKLLVNMFLSGLYRQHGLIGISMCDHDSDPVTRCIFHCIQKLYDAEFRN